MEADRIEYAGFGRRAAAFLIDAVIQFGERTAEFGEQCTPGYYNNEGQPEKKSRQSDFYFEGPSEFVEILEAWRTDGSMKGLELCEEGQE